MTAAYRAVPAAPSPPSLYEAWEQFKAERSLSLQPTTLASDYRQVSQWLQRCPVQDLEEGRKVLLWVLGQQPPLSTRKICMFVRSLYRWAASEDVGMLARNPVLNFRMPKRPQKQHEVQVIPRDEIALVLIALEHKAHHRAVNWSLFAEFMLQTAMRTGEVRAMKWTDIRDGKLLVHSNYTLTHGHKASTKTNKQRVVPLNARAQEILASVPKDNDYVFPWNRSSFQSHFRNKIDELHQYQLIRERYRPYTLRHVAISRWLEAGIPIAQVARWAGNTSDVIWKFYANATTEYEVPVL